MTRQRISEEGWVQFVDEFSKSHTGEPATIMILGSDCSVSFVTKDVPLAGISFDVERTRSSSRETTTSDHAGHIATHVIDKPLPEIETEGGDHDVALKIEPAVGAGTLPRLSGTAAPTASTFRARTG
jgi:hypothetical protein